MRERGNIWPVIFVAAGAVLVLVVVPLLLQRQKTDHMATVEANVSIGDGGSFAVSTATAAAYRWPDGEVPRTAERLRDTSAVAIAAITYVVETMLAGRSPRDVNDIMRGITRSLPPEWLTNQSGVLRMPHGTVHVRYSPASLSVEVLSAPHERIDGPAILIRIPDLENTTVGARYFESMQLDGVLYPHPFAPIPEIIAAGWRPRLFKQTQLPDAERARLEQWARTTARK